MRSKNKQNREAGHLKVLIVNTVSFSTNGITAVILNNLKFMDKSGLEIHILAINEPPEAYQKQVKEQGAITHVINRRGGVVKYVWQLFRLMLKERFDVIHVHGNSAGMAIELMVAWLTGTKIRIAHAHNTKTEHERMHQMLYPMFRKLCNVHLACGQQAGEFLYRGDSFIEIKNGVDLRKYDFDPTIRMKMRQELGVQDEILLGHIGIFEPVKNHRFLLEMFEELIKQNPHYKLVMLSDGSLFQEMKQKAKELGIEQNVIFVGRTNRVEQYMQAMDMLLLPSLYEGLPMVLVEAQAAGLPCLASDQVSRQANLAGLVRFLPITDFKYWIDEIQDLNVASDRAVCCQSAQKALTAAGYDIAQNANKLGNIYRKDR